MKYLALAVIMIIFISCEKQDPKPVKKNRLMVAPKFYKGTDNNKLIPDEIIIPTKISL